MEGECTGRISEGGPLAFHRRSRGRPGDCRGPIAGGVDLVFARQNEVPGRLPVASDFRGSEREGLRSGSGCGAAVSPGHTPGRRVRRQGRGHLGEGGQRRGPDGQGAPGQGNR